MQTTELTELKTKYHKHTIAYKVVIIILLMVSAYFINRNTIYKDDIRMVASLYNELNHKNTKLKKENYELREFKRMKDDLSK